MTDRTEGERLAAIETALESIGREIGELKKDVRDVLRGCPECKASLASHGTELESCSKRLDSCDKQVELLWARLWQVGMAAAAGGATISLVISHLWR